MKLHSRYSEDETPPVPVAEATLYDPLMENSVKISVKVDSGFSGSLLITLDQYTKLGLELYEEPSKATSGRLPTGTFVPLRASNGVLQLGPMRLESLVYSTPLLLNPLLGRELMNKWRVLLDGPAKTLEIETEK
ncbi:MAG: hypothetical protein HYU39_00645 [Thaumarchaeota archaeon]|nr:hypothetical protein [Nitrososphaerota archaeon]